MKFNPIKRILYTEEGQLIKKLDCPFTISAKEDSPKSGTQYYTLCKICSQQLIDTSTWSDAELLEYTEKHPTVCLKVDPKQKNVRIVYSRIN